MVAHTFNPRIWETKADSSHEFKATMGYKRSKQKQIQVVVAHAFNPSTRGECKTGGDRGSGLSFQSPSLGRGKTSLAIGRFAFLIFNLNPNFCLWVFITHATMLCFLRIFPRQIRALLSVTVFPVE